MLHEEKEARSAMGVHEVQYIYMVDQLSHIERHMRGLLEGVPG